MTTKPLLRVLDGEAVWPPPVWLMRQAGRYLPEYRALRDKAGDFLSLVTTPALAAEVTMQPVRRFGMDGAILFSDLPIVSWALGQDVRYEAGEGPTQPPIRTAADVAVLDPGRVAAAVAPIGETVSRCAGMLREGGTALIGFSGGVFTMACYMVEGGGSKDFMHTRLMAWREPALFDALLAVLEAAAVEYLDIQVRAGADCVMLFDSWAGILPPALFARYVTAPSARIVTALRVRHPGLRVIGFPRLAGTMAARYAADTGVNALALDTGAALHAPPHGVTQGNLDPMALVAGGEALRQGVAELLDAVRGRAHVFNLGHGIVPQTAPEHVAALVASVRGA